jgi:delta14-sterol reductase
MRTIAEQITVSSLGLAFLGSGVFVASLFLGSRFLPGIICAGAPLPDGSRRQYKLNGLALFALLLGSVGGGQSLGWLRLSLLCRNFWSYLVAANVFAFGLTVLLYLKGRRADHRPGEPGTRLRRVVGDLFFGIELNPLWLGVDLKMFSYRPSLMGLCLVNLSFAALQAEAFGHLTLQMTLYQVFCLIYVANYFQFEPGMLYTWDVIAERFGWGLVWGDYVLVPFFYSIAGWFLIDETEPLPVLAVLSLLILFVTGFILFRGANQQKHGFKTNPKTRIWGKPAEALHGKLLVSGFWGIGRKLNYTGELCLYFAWALLCGWGSWVPYLLPLWLTLLLGHRAWRDERRCRAKYGPLWNAYCTRARFRMIPFLY